MIKRKVAVVTGATSGLGLEVASALYNQDFDVISWSLETGVDLRDKASIEAAVKALPSRIDVLVNCAGVNGIEFIPKLAEEEWDRLMDTNAKGIFLVSQALLSRLEGPTIDSAGTILNIVSNAAHMPMTSSLAYNASKAAAWMMTRQMSRELIKTHNVVVFSISPNKLRGTGMSEYIDKRVCELRGWTPEEARKYQLASLPLGEETDPKALAEFVAFLLSDKARHKWFAGCDIPYGL